ncbi:hypothetical protein TR51_18810 [Kitasatospora griseola]|uniref:Uncharacterized protein n=1 Tax=Kitasatospora griseola TaxID=2064 RepID=A0A0D0P2G7_KITGR|nr:hypothetical protein [Kitasatospora griseola]KIQ65796.1 hypothetical protein TR51_18810 [Kitasatospora griseola]
MKSVDDTGRMDRADKHRVRRVLSTVRTDLFTFAPQPMPPMRGPGPLRWLPQLAVVVVAVFAAVYATEDLAVRSVGVAHAALLVVALRRPLPAWWVSLAMLPVLSLYEPLRAYTGWAWAVHAGLSFLVALRNPLRVMAETLVVRTGRPHRGQATALRRARFRRRVRQPDLPDQPADPPRLLHRRRPLTGVVLGPVGPENP